MDVSSLRFPLSSVRLRERLGSVSHGCLSALPTFGRATALCAQHQDELLSKQRDADETSASRSELCGPHPCSSPPTMNVAVIRSYSISTTWFVWSWLYLPADLCPVPVLQLQVRNPAPST